MTVHLIAYAAALAGTVLLILLAGQAAKRTRFARGRGQGGMRVEESLALDTRRRLVLVSVEGRRLLLLTGAHDQVVGWLPERAS